MRKLQFVLAMAAILLCASAARAQTPKTKAQQLVESTLAGHPEIAAVELAATSPGKGCQTVAATEAKEIGQKCDKDELTALRTNKPFVEKEVEGGKEVYDVTSPLHDSAGKLIGTVGMDVKPQESQTRASVLKLTSAVVAEMERQISSKATLFEAAQ